jgi:hypothetical protein
MWSVKSPLSLIVKARCAARGRRRGNRERMLGQAERRVPEIEPDELPGCEIEPAAVSGSIVTSHILSATLRLPVTRHGERRWSSGLST